MTRVSRAFARRRLASLRRGPSCTPARCCSNVPDRAELARADDWLALARILHRHDPYALRALGFFDRDRDLLARMIATLPHTAPTDEGLRPLSEAVLLRIDELVPDLASGAHGAIEIARLVELNESGPAAVRPQPFEASSARSIFASDWSSPQAIAGFCWTRGRKSQ